MGVLRPSLAADPPAKSKDGAAHDVDRQMLAEAPGILKQLRDKGYHNVAILKFRIEKGDQPVDRVGTLNMNLAERLEMALILKNDARNPLNIIHDASAVAAKTPGADHRTPAGLKKLFAAKYPLAWGRDRVSPDVFLIGAAKVDNKLSDLRSQHFRLRRQKRKTGEAVPVQREADGAGIGRSGAGPRAVRYF